MTLNALKHLDEDEFFYAIEELWETDLLQRIKAREQRYGISSGEAYARIKDGLVVETPDMLAWIKDFELAKKEGLL